MQGPFRLARLLVVAIWIGLLLALSRSQLPPTGTGDPAPLIAPAASSTGESDWSGLYMQGNKIGYAQSRLLPTADGFRLEESSAMRLTMLGEEQAVRAVITADADSTWAVRRFTVTIDSGVGSMAVRGEVLGGESLLLRMTTAGETTEQSLPLAEPIYLPSAARARLRALGLRQGARLEVPVFDPSAMQASRAILTVGGRETLQVGGGSVQAWRVTEAFRGIESVVWLDDQGRMLREQGPMGLEIRRESAADAVHAGWSETPVDLLGAVGVRSRGTIAAPRELARLRARLGGLGGVTPPSDARQQLDNGVLSIAREALPAVSYPLPYRGREWAAELRETSFLQISHPSVQAAAREALGDADDAAAAADSLRRWIRSNLRQRPAATVPNAVQVLQTRIGDCNEHAVLYAALARAVGLPARVVAGVVYLDGVFLYHAWNEVWLGERWVSVDPAFDQMPADATHIKLLEGGPETHADLMPLVGSLSIEILSGEGAGAG